jgi:xanthine dehydrogenase accessory factor
VTLKEKLAAKGADADALSRLTAPAGLPIGAATAEEIALSILAQIVQVRRTGVRP